MTHSFRNFSGLLVLLLSISITSFAQINKPDPIKFGKIEMADLQMKLYPKDSTADAVVLCDYANTYYQYRSSSGLQRIFERICRIKILKKSGYEWANSKIVYVKANGSNKEMVDKFKASTYNLESGKIVETKITKDAIFEEKINDEVYAKKFSLPNVREGSVVEYTYTIISDFDQNVPSWVFQKSIPTIHSEYRVSIPNYYYFRLSAQGFESFAVSQQGQGNFSAGSGSDMITTSTNEYHWILNDAPAMKEEPYMTTTNDYVNMVEFDLAAVNFPGSIAKSFSVTWQDLANDLLSREHFGEQMKGFGFLKDAAATIKTQKKDTLDRLKAAFEFVRSNIKWNENAGFSAENKLKKAFELKTGNDADINLMLVALIRELGLKANPVILSTRSHGRMMESYLLLNKFNYVIAQTQVGGKDLLLDATDHETKMGMLPMRCLNGIGRLIAKDESEGRWVSLNPTERDNKVVIMNLTLSESGEASGTWDTYHNGYDGLEHKRSIVKDGKAKYIDEIKKNTSGIEFTKFEIQESPETSPSVTIKTEVKTENVGQIAAGRIYFKPLLVESQSQNPFKVSKRRFPVDLGAPIEENITVTYTLPKGYVVDELPKSIRMNLPEDGGRFQFIINSTNDGKVVVSSKVFIKKPIYFAEEYDGLKQFFDQIIAKHAEQIVLKKQ
jgi:hypothetical protein